MSSDNSEVNIEDTDVLLDVPVEESSKDTPMDEWSSVVTEQLDNEKRALCEQGLYSPGSGEICAKYLSMSISSILKHPYYNYPAVLDPGITEALLEPQDEVIYASDGQDLYLAVCKEMNQCPVRMFHKSLLSETINLKYYCVNPYGVRPMAIALKNNRYVTVLDLSDNFLNVDSCFHLGDMLKSNIVLRELILDGCRIGALGAKNLFAGLTLNKSLWVLNLNRNELEDKGVEYLAEVVFQGIHVREIFLRYNTISSKSANTLAEAFETHNSFTCLDLSWNNYYTPGGAHTLITRLAENNLLQDLNLSWNSLSNIRVATAIKTLLKAKNLRHLDLSNNKFNGEAISTIIENLGKAKKLITLNLSYNPLTPDDALIVLSKFKSAAVKVQNLLMENVFVNGEFLNLLQNVKELKFRKNTVITYGGVIGGYKTVGPDMRDLVLNRADFLATRPKKRPKDIALLVMQLLKDGMNVMTGKDFATAITDAGAPLDDSLIDEIVNLFPTDKITKVKTISIESLVDYMQRKWPERKLPPTPPPEPEGEPSSEPQPEPESTPVEQIDTKGKSVRID